VPDCNQEASALWNEHHVVAPYPEGVVAVPTPIRGTAFFPGGYGLWAPTGADATPAWPVGGVMVVGQDFHSEAGYNASYRAGREDERIPTWRHLVDILDRAGIALNRCFFTNAFMGLRRSKTCIGRFPGATDATFTARCASFLAVQIARQHPRLILTLGVHAPRVLALLSSSLHDWRGPLTMKRLDTNGAGPVRLKVPFPEAAHVVAAVVTLTHPSLRGSNVRHRRYQELSGDAAELAMLRYALAGVGDDVYRRIGSC
jgi:hypothetical protein